MQRRAAAVSAAVLLLIAAGAYAFAGAAAAPTVDVPADHTLSAGQQVTLNGTQYTVASVGPESPEATLNWTETDVRRTATLDNGSEVTRANTTYAVVIPNESSPSTFTLREQLDVEAMLAADDSVENQTVTRSDGQEYVVYRNNGSTKPLSEYLPEPQTQQYSEGDSYQYAAEEETVDATVGNVTTDAVMLQWTVPSVAHQESLSEGTNVTNTEYFAHFPDNSTLVLSSDHEAYRTSLQRIEYFHERIRGVTGVGLLSILTAIVLLALAYLPSRY